MKLSEVLRGRPCPPEPLGNIGHLGPDGCTYFVNKRRLCGGWCPDVSEIV